MNKYDLVFEAVQESLNNGEITLEEAEFLNDYAYDKYMEATRFAKEIHRKNMSTNPEKGSAEYYDKLYDITAKDSIETGKNRPGRGRLEQEDIGRSRKRYGKHPGYKEGQPNYDYDKNGKYLKLQHSKDTEKGKQRDSDYYKKYKEQEHLSLKHRNEEVDKINNYYKNSNRHNHYTQK